MNLPRELGPWFNYLLQTEQLVHLHTPLFCLGRCIIDELPEDHTLQNFLLLQLRQATASLVERVQGNWRAVSKPCPAFIFRDPSQHFDLVHASNLVCAALDKLAVTYDINFAIDTVRSVLSLLDITISYKDL